MAERRPAVVANWKMYLTGAESVRAAESLRRLLAREARAVDVILCPSPTLLTDLQTALFRSRLLLGAQDARAEDRGPFTGDVSVRQLPRGVRYVIVGHSERRRMHGETDDVVAEKMRRVLRAGLHPVVCVGETAEERDGNATIARVRAQVTRVLQGLPVLELPRILFAYEPVWAISAGPGNPAPQPEPQDAAEIMGLIRKVAAEVGARRYADKMRVLYGGSVTAGTVRPFVAEPGVDGVLVGGASTNPGEFAAIVKEVLASTHHGND